jgi:cytidylate kinase
MKRIVVAVDGPAGTGKSSVCRLAAVDLGLRYIDSGAVYRSITWYVLRRDKEVTGGFRFTGDISALAIRHEFFENGSCRTYVNSTDVTEVIRDSVITTNIGIISDNRDVRNFVNHLLRRWSHEGSAIIDGRDIGSIVFPDADVKIYLDASVETRALRRIKEYREMGKNVDENVVKKEIILRDEQDRSRPFGALIRSDDAVYIDTSCMSREQAVEKMKEVIQSAVSPIDSGLLRTRSYGQRHPGNK